MTNALQFFTCRADIPAQEKISFGKDPVHQEISSNSSKDDRSPVTHVEGSLNYRSADSCIVTDPYEPGSNNRKEDTHTCDQHRQQDRREAVKAIVQGCTCLVNYFMTQY